jgi:hypothetical protein
VLECIAWDLSKKIIGNYVKRNVFRGHSHCVTVARLSPFHSDLVFEARDRFHGSLSREWVGSAALPRRSCRLLGAHHDCVGSSWPCLTASRFDGPQNQFVTNWRLPHIVVPVKVELQLLPLVQLSSTVTLFTNASQRIASFPALI